MKRGNMNREESQLLEKSIEFALKAHSGAMRKGGGYPYIVHPLETMEIVSHLSDDAEVLAAAVLHDVIEDTPYTYEDIKTEFGQRVADLVNWESEDKMRDRPASETWRERKEETISRDKEAPLDVKMILLGDKLSNMRGSRMDFRKNGDSMWQKFNMKDKSQQEWYYRAICTIIPELSDTLAYAEYCEILDEVFG